MNNLLIFLLLIFTSSCSSIGYPLDQLPKVDLQKFMGNWYVVAGRFTFLEKDVHNALEVYTWNEKKKRIDVSFTYHQGSFTGSLKSIPQKAWVVDLQSNSHWKVSPFWPIKLDYLILDIDENYRWTAIGVPNQKYLWIMTRSNIVNLDEIQMILKRLEAKGYNVDNIVYVPQEWSKK
jgi:apolipoprotein D and lipocalin family protein